MSISVEPNNISNKVVIRVSDLIYQSKKDSLEKRASDRHRKIKYILNHLDPTYTDTVSPEGSRVIKYLDG